MREIALSGSKTALHGYKVLAMPNLQNLDSATTSAPVLSAHSRVRGLTHPGFNLQMIYAGIGVVLIALLGCPVTSVRVSDFGTLALGFGAVLVVTIPVVLFLQEWKRLYLRDALLTILWAFFFRLMLGFPVTVAARLGMDIPLYDLQFKQWDSWIGLDVLRISEWASTHQIGILISQSYPLLFPFMQIAILLPILAGQLKCAQRFLLANLIAFAIGLPLFSLFPAIGPWCGSQIEPNLQQRAAEAMVVLIREPGIYLYRYPLGVICFPSFHVIWAMLCGQAFWGFRLLRIPATLFAVIIVLSTLTTGNHYFVDVIAGILVAVAAIMIANRISKSFVEHQVPSLLFWRT